MDDSDCKADTTPGVCLPSGACAAQTAILHTTSQSGSNDSDCGSPAKPCTLKNALAIASATKTVIRLDDDGPFIDDGYAAGGNVTLDARGSATGAVLKRSTAGPVLTIDSGKALTLLGGTVREAIGTGGDGIRCNGATLFIFSSTIELNSESAIDAQSCSITIAKSFIRNNLGTSSNSGTGLKVNSGSLQISQSVISGNQAGGINVSAAAFKIIGNVFQENGAPGNIVGGIFINTATLGNLLEFNTITTNKTQATTASGVNCSADTDFVALNNIIWNNNNGTTGAIQIGGACPHAYSDIGPGTLAPGGLNAGHNIFDDPMLINEMTDAHPKHGSPVHNLAQPTADLTGVASQDLDGHPRVAGAGGVGADLGAYVVP